MWDSIGSTYMEAAAGILPLQRAAVFGVAFVVALLLGDHEFRSVAESLSKLPLTELLSFETKLLEKSTANELFLGVSAVLLSVGLSKLTLRIIFNLANRAVRFQERAELAMASLPCAPGKSLIELLQIHDTTRAPLVSSKRR